jgi:protein-tyrosine phosphatase
VTGYFKTVIILSHHVVIKGTGYMAEQPLRILMVCLGNICRSPTAEAVLRTLASKQGMADKIQVDSAGLLDYHQGEPPDHRAIAAGQQRGYDLTTLRARQITSQDWLDFDLILAMDKANLNALLAKCPREYQHKLKLLLEFAKAFAGQEVADPYYGGPSDFIQVLDRVEAACQGLLAQLPVKV